MASNLDGRVQKIGFGARQCPVFPVCGDSNSSYVGCPAGILKLKGLVLQRNKCVPEKQFTAEKLPGMSVIFFFNLRKQTGKERER